MNVKSKNNQSIKLLKTPIFLKSGFSGVPDLLFDQFL